MLKPLPEVFHYLDEIAFFLCMAGILVLIAEIAFRYGRRRAKKEMTADLGGQVSALGGTLLGLVALLLGFAFAMALGRFNTRQDLLRQEVNDIQAAYLRADTLGYFRGAEMKNHLAEYTRLRVEYYTPGTLAAQMQENIAQTDALQKKMWKNAVDLLNQANKKTDLSPGQVSDFMGALTRVFTDENNRTAARGNHIPEAILWLLIFVSACAVGTVAYGVGLKGSRILLPIMVLIVAICAVLSIILDLDRPIRGIIRIGQRDMAALHEMIEKDVKAIPITRRTAVRQDGN